MELFKKTQCSQGNVSLWIIRTGIGILFCIFGILKLIGGQQTWIFVGSAMSTIGITCVPMFWGLCAACAELFGGLSLVSNRFVKIGAALISCVMIVAFIMLISQGKEFSAYSYPIAMLIIMLGLIF
jgi:putative oxidoreductase